MRRILWMVAAIVGLLFISPGISAQKEGNIWYFGNNAGLDFNTGTPVAITNGALATNEGCASVCNEAGELLFYTDGMTVYNKNHVAMANGTGLSGNGSATQSAVIVPQPGSATTYFIFTVSQSNPSQFRYSIVDMTANSGLGRVSTKNTNVFTSPGTDENICAIRGANMYWIVVHRRNSNTFNAYRLTSTGFNSTAVTTNIGANSDILSEPGYMKSNLNGTKLALANYQTNRTQVFDFNKLTGALTNAISLTTYRNYGLEFSPNGQFLYAHGWGYGVYQYNLEAGNASAIQSSRVVLAPARYEGAMQLGPDGKIYIANNGQGSISVINNPNELGTDCNYSYASVSLGGATSTMGLPTVVHSILRVLPVQLLSFKAKAVSNRTELEWTFEPDRYHTRMILQRSADGIGYHDIERFDAAQNPELTTQYYIDQHPMPGNNYYRLKQVDLDGREQILQVRMVKHLIAENAYWFSNQRGSVTVLSPAEPGVLYELIDIRGAAIRRGRISGNRVNFTGLLPGTYFVRLQNNRKEVLKIVVSY